MTTYNEELPILKEEEFDIEKYWKIIRPRLHIVIITALVCLMAGWARTAIKKTVYEATGLLMIEPEKDIIDFGGMYSYSDYRNEYFNTQINILNSSALLDALDEELLSTAVLRRDSNVTYQVGIDPIKETRLVSVSCVSTDPRVAAAVVNTLFSKYVEFNLSLKNQSSRTTSEFISKQIRDLRATLSQKEMELQEYGKSKELFFLSGQESTVVEKFGTLNKAYTQAQIERLNAEVAYNELRNMKYEDFPQVKQSSMISTMKTNYSTLEADYQKKAQLFKESYPEMVQLRSQMDTLRSRIDQETRDLATKTLKEASNNFQSASKKEESLLALLNEQKKTVNSSNTDAIYYNSLNIEVTNIRNLLDLLVRREKETMVSSRMEGAQTSNIKIVESATVPQAPLGKGLLRNLFLAFFMGLIGGIAFIFLADFLDRSIKTADEVQSILGVPALGLVSSSQARKGGGSVYGTIGAKEKKKTNQPIELINHTQPNSIYAENYRTIRTSIMLSTPKESPRILCVTSALPEEGKSATLVNLSVSFAQTGKRVLIIDGDMRKPRIHKIFALKNTNGLTSYLTGGADLNSIINKTEVPNLFVITSGPLPPNPAELIESSVMADLLKKLLEKVDYIFIDTPPLIGIVDPILIARLADGLILVIWGGNTSRTVLEKSIKELHHFNIRLLGVVLNKLHFKHHNYQAYYNYNTKYLYQYKEQDKESAPSTAKLYRR